MCDLQTVVESIASELIEIGKQIEKDANPDLKIKEQRLRSLIEFAQD